VVGVPDPYRGETVKAFVVLKEGQEATAAELIAHCRQHLTPYKVPRLLEFRSDLPKSLVGKVLRRVMVEEETRRQQQRQEAGQAAAPWPAALRIPSDAVGRGVGSGALSF